MTILTRSMSRIFLIFICVSAVATASGASPAGGRLVIVRTANFGWNIALNVKIDGRTLANVVQGRSFDRVIPAGTHTVTVSVVPNNYFADPTSITLNVKSGQMYSFVATWVDANRVVLKPTQLTPSQLAQLPY
jgi:hypothetical protein